MAINSTFKAILDSIVLLNTNVIMTVNFMKFEIDLFLMLITNKRQTSRVPALDG